MRQLVEPVDAVLRRGDRGVGALRAVGQLALELGHTRAQPLDLGLRVHGGSGHGEQRSRDFPAIHRAMPRLIEATGERIVPWARDAQVIYEHYHRYLWTRPLVAGRRVLDLGSGEGYGAALLAQTASAVTGVDIDERTVEHSAANYPDVEFHVGSATDLSAFADGSFDAVVAFEMIEHVAEHDRVLAEIVRVLAPDGLVLMSTPERHAYSDDRDFCNPYHARELTQAEFTALLRGHFESVALFAQRAIAGSRLEALEPGDGDLTLRVERADDEWREAGIPEPLYLVAVAANAALPGLPAESTLIDYGLEVLAEREARSSSSTCGSRTSAGRNSSRYTRGCRRLKARRGG